MFRRSWLVSGVSAVVLGAAAGQDAQWSPSAKPPAARHDAPKPTPLPNGLWKPSRRAAQTMAVAATGQPEWQAMGIARPSVAIDGWRATIVPRILETTSTDAPAVVEASTPLPALLPVTTASVAVPHEEAALVPASFKDVSQLSPVVVPEPPMVKPVEPAPLPQAVDPPRAPLPKVMPSAGPLSVTAPVKTLPGPAPVMIDESTAVWGAYNQPRTVATIPGTTVAVADAPVRHGTYGSPALHLSRDYHFLDALTRRLGGDPEAGILAEPAAPAKSFASAEYLLWWVNNGEIPVLASTGGARRFGYIGDPGTTALIGAGPFGQSQRSGVRLRAGTWFDEPHTGGIDASVFVLGSVETTQSLDSTQFSTIARPFFAPNFNSEFSELVAFPGLSTGRLTVDQTSFLWGADVNYRRCIQNDCDRRCEWFAGYRYLNLQERLTITEFLLAGPSAPDPVGTNIVVRDRFSVKNNFNGGQVGALSGWRFGDVSVDARGSVALGVTSQSLSIEGNQSKTVPGQPTQNFTGGLLAAGPNLGDFDTDKFSVVPEATLALGYYVRPHLKAYVGYNFIAWTNVLRPGDSIDRVVDLTFVPNAPAVPFSGQQRPQPQFNQSTLYINGIQFGIEGSW